MIVRTIRRLALFAALIVLLSEVQAQTVVGTAVPEPALRPFTPEIAVWPDGQLTGAPAGQSNPMIAVNGEIALVAWADSRDTNGSSATYAARLDRNGKLLDPGGVRVSAGRLRAVVWNGETFAVITEVEIVFVAPDMTVTRRKPFGVSSEYQLVATKPGPNARLLYLAPWLTPELASVLVVDGHGNIVSRRNISNPNLKGFPVAAALDDGFMVLTSRSGQPPVANRLSSDGDLLSSVPTGLPFKEGPTVMDGDRRGFLIVHWESQNAKANLIAHHLDASGAFTGRSIELAHQQGVYDATLVKDGDRYIVAWDGYFAAVGRAAQFVASVGADDAAKHTMQEWNGYGGDIALALTAGGPLIADIEAKPAVIGSDLFVRLVADPEQPGDSLLVSAALPEQGDVDIAAAANGYAVVWVETGPDAISRLLLRRFSPMGVPLDFAPIEVASVPYEGTSIGAPRIVSNGETYLIAWWQRADSGYYIRRLAASGQWVDARPMLLQLNSPLALASNGRDAMALSVDYSAQTRQYTLRARPIAMTGPALDTVPVNVRGPMTDHSLNYLAIGSNGTDYLVGWVESIPYPFPYCCFPDWMYVARLRADGTLLDAQPLQLNVETDGVWGSPVIAASDRLYFIAFPADDGVRGTRLTSEGAMLDRDSDGSAPLLSSSVGIWGQSAHAAGMQNQFLLLMMTYSESSPTYELSTYLDVAKFVASAAPKLFPRTPLIGAPDRLRQMPAMAVRDGVVALAYRRMAAESGDVRRAFLRLYTHGGERRRAAGR